MPLVAIVGAPNIGKSTLFNRLIGRRKAIVTDEPGVTRDRNYGVVAGAAVPFRVVDTGGLTPRSAAPFAREIQQQAESALDEAALVLLVVDARTGVTSVDVEVAGFLRRRSVPVVLVANKIDTPNQFLPLDELYALGLADPVPVSAEHGLGMDELLDVIERHLAHAQVDAEPPASGGSAPIRFALIGRPNVGKSSLLNRLLGEERVVVSDIPGTTRDTIDTLLEVDGRRYLLVDTAGLRRRGRARLAAEATSVVMARRAIQQVDVVVLVIDAAEEFAAQDAHVAGYAHDAFKPLIVAVNKWDLVGNREDEAKQWTERLRTRLKFFKQLPIVLVSARTGQRVGRILELVDEAYRAAGRRVPTPELNRWLAEVSASEASAPARGRSIHMLYAAQTGVHPPRFTIVCNDPDHAHFSLRRHLENGLRERFGFGAVPLNIEFRKRRRRRRDGS